MSQASTITPQYIIDNEGNKQFVILPIIKFNQLLEDLEDLSIALERKSEATVSHKELIKELKRDGYL